MEDIECSGISFFTAFRKNYRGYHRRHRRTTTGSVRAEILLNEIRLIPVDMVLRQRLIVIPFDPTDASGGCESHYRPAN